MIDFLVISFKKIRRFVVLLFSVWKCREKGPFYAYYSITSEAS